MTRLNAFIMMVLVLSALYLVKVAYESRSLFVALDRAQNEERALDVEYEKLQVDKRGQATPMRVEKMAREKLGMTTATPAVTQYVQLPASAPAGAPQVGVSEDGIPLRPGEATMSASRDSRVERH
jgi:cell division protein FtsL